MKFMQSALVCLLAIETSSAFTVGGGSIGSRSRFGLALPQQKQQQQRLQVTLSDPDTDISAADDSDDVPAAVEEEIEHTLYVGNLPFTTTQEDIRALFGDSISIKSVSMPTNPIKVDNETGLPLSKGFAFVTVETEDMITKAVDQFNDTEFSGRSIRVNKLLPKDEVSKLPKRSREFALDGKKKLYVGNLPFDATVDDVRDYFSQFGEISDVFLPERDGRTRGFGFVTLDDEGADLALKETNGAEFMGRTLTVNEPLGKGEKMSKPRQYKIYVGNLSFYTNEETLKGVFEEFGDVYDCYIPLDPNTDRPRGFAFVTMDQESGAEAIAELDNLELDGRFIRVNEAQGKKKPTNSFSRSNDSYNEEDGGFYSN